MSIVPWVLLAGIVVVVVRLLPRLLRGLRGPIPDVGEAPEDAEPAALVLPNDDGLFTWSLRLPEDPPAKRQRE